MITEITKVDGNQGDLARPTNKGMIEVASTRAAQEVQAAMVVAKNFPRDTDKAYMRIMKACTRKLLAEQSMYSYPRGDQTVTGPSIRLAEELARDWGNIDFGTVELEQKNGESTMMAYAWDLETNTRQTKIFSVQHFRSKNVWQGGKKVKINVPLDDPRDVYEMTANQGARRMRACILGVIPGDIVEAALVQCEDTLKSDNSEPIGDRIRKMISAFSEIGVTKEMVETRLRHKTDIITEAELIQLRKVFQAIRDNMADRSAYFDLPSDQQPKTGVEGLADRVAKKTEPAPEPVADAPDEGMIRAELSGFVKEMSKSLKANYGVTDIDTLSGEPLEILRKRVGADYAKFQAK
jgi:hypothetical protein